MRKRAKNSPCQTGHANPTLTHTHTHNTQSYPVNKIRKAITSTVATKRKEMEQGRSNAEKQWRFSPVEADRKPTVEK